MACSFEAAADVFWQLSAAMGMPVWWAPRHGDVAEPMQIVPYAVGIGPLGSKFHRFERMRGVCRDQQPAARPRVLVVIWRDLRGPARGKCPAPTPPYTLKAGFGPRGTGF